jgi:hypothetical protein
MGVQSDFNLDRLRLDITPPNTTAYCSNGQVCGEVDNVIASIVFAPHSTIPSNILGQYGHRYILQQITIETKGGILSLHWSPVVQ